MTTSGPGVHRPTVLYIGGFGRSGSTLLERVLGQVPGTVAVGEMVHLLERGLVGDQDCGCGLPFHDCPFWSDVGAKAFGGWDRVAGPDWMLLKRRVDRNRYVPLMIAPIFPPYRRLLALYTERLGRLYEAIAEVSGAEVIVDSSKHASTAFLLRRVHSVRLNVLHLVRDSRGVAYSWTKEVTRPEIHNTVALMPRFHPASAATHWFGYNVLFELLGLVGTPVRTLRYEDFLAAPVAETTRAIAATGRTLGPDDLAFLSDRHVDLLTDHSVAGNPMRFRTGRIELRFDDAWRNKLSRYHRFTVTTITAPLLARYHYLGRRHASEGATQKPPQEFPTSSVSVIVATRDRPELLRRAIDSILSQRYDGPIEVLVVFDQSEPDPSLIKTGNGRTVRVMTNTRTPGLPGARNTGALKSDRQILAFCDDDDVWSPGKLEAQVALLDANPSMEVATCGLFIDSNGRTTVRVLPTDRVTFQDLLRSRIMEAHPSTYVVRRDAMLDGIGLVDEEIPGGYGEDYDWLLRAARRHDVGAVSLPLTRVYWHRSSFFAERWQTINDALEYLLAKYPEFAAEPVGLARILGQQAFALAAMHRSTEARAKARQALRLHPTERRAYLAYLTSSRLLRTDRVLRLLQAAGRGV